MSSRALWFGGGLITGIVFMIARRKSPAPAGKEPEQQSARPQSELDRLLNVDAENVEMSRLTLEQFHPRLREAFDQAEILYATFGKLLSGADTGDDLAISAVLNELEITGEELVRQIETGATAPQIERARIIVSRIEARRVRVLLMLLLHRQFMWAVTDIYKYRVTSAAGYLRQQAESIALLHIFRDDPTLARTWMKIQTDTDGRAFYRQTQVQILDILRGMNLSRAYELGSGAALHVRLASAVRGRAFQIRQRQRATDIGIRYQEINPEDPFEFYLNLLFFLRCQERIVAALHTAFPELMADTWTPLVQDFSRLVDMLWQRLEALYPERCVAMRNAQPAE